VRVTYDLLGRKTALESLDSWEVEYTYDGVGNVIGRPITCLRSRGEAILYEYE
jgi:YD repeat-containing protein